MAEQGNLLCSEIKLTKKKMVDIVARLATDKEISYTYM